MGEHCEITFDPFVAKSITQCPKIFIYVGCLLGR